ncbi:YybS family protein [Bacillaceae bacterium S4-13-58]
MKSSNIIANGAMLLAIYTVLLLISLYIPILDMVTFFVLPVPVVWFVAKYGPKPSIPFISSALLLSAIFGTIFSVPLTVLASIGGLTLGLSFYYKKTAYERLLISTVGFLFGFIIVLGIIQMLFEINLIEEMNEILETSFETTYEVMGPLVNEEVKQEMEGIQEQLLGFRYLIPSLLVMVSLLHAFITQWVSQKMMNRLDRKAYSFPPFREFKLPVSVIWYYLAGLLLMWLNPDTSSLLNQIGLNLYYLLGMLLILQGFSFLFYVSYVKEWPKAVPALLVILSILLSFVFLYIIRILGIIDLGFSLRNRIKKNGPK